jgi:hypothetical protein
MTPAPDSPYLRLFKESYKKTGEYLLVPPTYGPDGSNLRFAPSLGIRKRVIHFRNTSEIGPSDADAIVLHTGSQDRPLTEYGRSRRDEKKDRKGR